MKLIDWQSWWQKRRADAGAIFCLLLFFVCFFARVLFGRRFIIADDALYYSYPLRSVAWRMLRQGTWPIWTTSIFSGYPLLSMAQLGLAYPFTWTYLFLRGPWAEQIYVLAPFLLAPIFTYAYLRELKRSRLAAILGALTFGYGGMMASPLASNGLLPNAVMWLPLLLIALERSRHRNFVPCLLGATAAYAMSVLTGCGQGFLFVGVMAGLYALFLVISGSEEKNSLRARLSSLKQWRPVFVAGGAAIFSMGIAAFQILETARAVRRSVRNTLSYEIFTQGSFPPLMLVQSFVSPLFHFIDMTAYVLPLGFFLALVAVWVHIRERARRDPRIFFWLATAVMALVLMLGAFTPLYRVAYHLPILNRFRVPSRYTFQWTFAVAVLAAYGWDRISDLLQASRARRQRALATTFYATLALLGLAIVVGVLWSSPRGILDINAPDLARQSNLYVLWKSAFVLPTTAALWRASLINSKPLRKAALLACVLLTAYVEPSIMVRRWWSGRAFTATRFETPGLATRYLQQFAPVEGRIYERVDLMSEQFTDTPRFDAPNLSALWGLHNTGGYEPLILDRYSRALGGVGLDSVLRFSSRTPDPSLLGPRSHVLDILNTRFLLSYSNLALHEEARIADGNIFSDMRIPSEVQPQATGTLTIAPAESDSLMLVTTLANSVLIPQGTPVARVQIHTTSGVFEREIRAGIETAEWAHDRPDVRAIIKHELAPIFDTTQIQGRLSFPAYRYKTVLRFDKPERVTEIEISNVTQSAPLAIYSGALINSKAALEVPLGIRPAENWQPIYNQHETLILRNNRVQPRAWLVTEAEAVDGEEALRRIRGESATDFDPQRTALLEMRRDDLPQLPGGPPSANSSAHITNYEPNRLRIETSAATATVLVVSEMFYPGWVASIDGRPAPIHLADYLLRGVALPPGQHVVEMRYTAPAARNGAIISVLTLLVIATLSLYAWRKRSPGL